jgi:hypothetical protein
LYSYSTFSETGSVSIGKENAIVNGTTRVPAVEEKRTRNETKHGETNRNETKLFKFTFNISVSQNSSSVLEIQINTDVSRSVNLIMFQIKAGNHPR